MQKKLKTDNHTILKYNRSEQHKNQIDNLNTHFAWKKSSWMMIRSKRVRFYFETWRVQTDVRLGWFTRPLHPTTALVSFKHILPACREFGRFLDIWPCYIQTLVLRISYISRLHPTTTLVSFKPILYAGNLEHPLVEFEDILCGHVTSKFWFWEYPSFNPSSMHGTLLRNFENIWHNQGTFDPTTALLS